MSIDMKNSFFMKNHNKKTRLLKRNKNHHKDIIYFEILNIINFVKVVKNEKLLLILHLLQNWFEIRLFSIIKWENRDK